MDGFWGGASRKTEIPWLPSMGANAGLGSSGERQLPRKEYLLELIIAVIWGGLIGWRRIWGLIGECKEAWAAMAGCEDRAEYVLGVILRVGREEKI